MENAVIVIIALCLASFGHASPPAGEPMSHFYHWKPATNATRWVVFLPGASGLRVLKDDHHYFGVAERLNRQGWSVLLVDYKPAYQASGTGPKGTAGEKIEWVTGQAIGWLHQQYPETSNLPGALVGWSLGAEGAIRFINNRVKSTTPGIVSAVVYYPSTAGRPALNNQVPLLILTGGADDVSRASDVRALVQDRSPGAAEVDLKLYPDACHGFDIASLTKRTTVRLLPLIGPKATLQYHAEAAQDAEQQLIRFLNSH